MPEWAVLLFAFLAILIVLMLLRVPVAIALLAVNLGGVIWFFGWEPGTRQLVLSTYEGLTTFVLSPVPLFILMGEVLLVSGLAERALAAIDRSMGRLPGRMGLVTTMGGTVFGVLSGSTLANTALLGKTFLPQMRREGYSPRFAMGSILASGGLAMIIPPSALAVVWGATAGVPIGPLLIAGILPGLLMACNYILLLVGWSWLAQRRGNAPPVAGAGGSAVVERHPAAGLVRDVLPLTFLVAIVLGLIFLGVATPTESAALGALGAVVISAAYRRLTWPTVRDAFLGSAKTTSMIFFILVGSGMYSRVMSFGGATSGIVETLTGIAAHPIVVLLLMQLVLIVLGFFLEQVSIMLVTLPFFMPVVASMGWDPLWFGIIMLINLQIALTTPPFGMSLFVMKGVAPPDVRLVDVYLAALPFVLADLFAIALIILVPGIVLFLPSLM